MNAGASTSSTLRYGSAVRATAVKAVATTAAANRWRGVDMNVERLTGKPARRPRAADIVRSRSLPSRQSFRRTPAHTKT